MRNSTFYRDELETNMQLVQVSLLLVSQATSFAHICKWMLTLAKPLTNEKIIARGD